MRRRFWIGFLALALTVGLAGAANAHAFLTRAVPAPNAALTQPPEEVRLEFTEEVETQFGAVSVYNAVGARVDRGDAGLDPHDPTVVVAGLKPLPAGAYTVAWHVISADGHPVGGAFGFQVGPASPNAVYYQPGRAESGAPPLVVLFSYWLSVGGLLALMGLGVTQGAVARAAPGQRYRWTVAAALVSAFAGTALLLVGRTIQASGLSLWDVLTRSLWLQMLATQSGTVIAWRLGIVAVSTVLLHFFWPRWWTSAVAGAAALLTVAMGGHAVSLADPVTAVLLDWFHLLAAAVWAGGLLQFALGLTAGGDVGALVRRFSPLAAVSVAVLALTGLYPALARIPSWTALTGTGYGVALLVKLGLILPLLVLGGINLVVVGPRLQRGEPAQGWLRGVATAEAVLIALVLAAATVLTNTPPPR
ncbi:MAG TPA: copper resistance protein CopC [Symbiobacteriaceae bacterium]|jgi:copper transport protein